MYVLLIIPILVGLSIALYVKLKASEHKVAVLLEKLKFRDVLLEENQTKLSNLETSIEMAKAANLQAVAPIQETQPQVEKAAKKRKYYRRPKQ